MVTQDCLFCDGRPGGCAHCNGTGQEPPSREQEEQMRANANQLLARHSQGSTLIYKETGTTGIVKLPNGKGLEAVCSRHTKEGTKGELVFRQRRIFFRAEQKF